MIPKVAKRGQRTAGLLYYLWGPGKADEHSNPHMVAAWDDSIIARFDPATSENASVPTLARLLDLPVEAMEANRPRQHVYHVPVRVDPGDRVLSDAEFADVAREILSSVDLTDTVRWVAMRHADDHIHIVATLATHDGKVPVLRKDFPRMQARARELEKRLGLRQLRSGDRTAKTWPTQAELEKARRLGRTESPRVTLQARVREAAAGARSEADFFTRLANAGVRVNTRTSVTDGAVTGYSVALPGDRTAGRRAVWFPGSKLAPDLSWPRVQSRWDPAASPAGFQPPATRTEAWQQAAENLHQATVTLRTAGDHQGAELVAALGDTLTLSAAHAPAYVRDELKAAAASFERAGRSPITGTEQSEVRQTLKAAGQALMMGAALMGGGGEAAAALALLTALVLAVAAAYEWHRARQHTMQAEAAGVAAQHLRTAEEVARGAVSAENGGQPPAHRQRAAAPASPRQEDNGSSTAVDTVQRTLPQHAARVLADEAWPALAAALEAAEEAGYEPGTVLAEVAAQRELTSADSAAQVLTWRLQGRMRKDGQIPPTSPTARAPRRTTSGPQPSGMQPAHQRANQARQSDPQRRGHGR